MESGYFLNTLRTRPQGCPDPGLAPSSGGAYIGPLGGAHSSSGDGTVGAVCPQAPSLLAPPKSSLTPLDSGTDVGAAIGTGVGAWSGVPTHGPLMARDERAQGTGAGKEGGQVTTASAHHAVVGVEAGGPPGGRTAVAGEGDVAASGGAGPGGGGVWGGSGDWCTAGHEIPEPAADRILAASSWASWMIEAAVDRAQLMSSSASARTWAKTARASATNWSAVCKACAWASMSCPPGAKPSVGTRPFCRESAAFVVSRIEASWPSSVAT